MTNYPEQRAPLNPRAFDRASVARRVAQIDIDTVPVFGDPWAAVLEVITEQLRKGKR